MSNRERPRFPSVTFIGALLGIVGALLVRPQMMLTADGTIVWLLVWTALGLAAGAVAEVLAHRAGRNVESPLDIKASGSHNDSPGGT